MLNLCYIYYLSKLTEFADTIFFVLRKKKSQITLLHLYHHALTPMEAWFLVKFMAGKDWNWTGCKKNYSTVEWNFRRQRNVPKHSQQLCSRADVFLLYVICNGTTIPKVSLVETLYDWNSNCKFCCLFVCLFLYFSGAADACWRGAHFLKKTSWLLYCLSGRVTLTFSIKFP